MNKTVIQKHLESVIEGVGASLIKEGALFDREACKEGLKDYLQRLDEYKVQHFKIVCDSTNNTEADAKAGRLNFTVLPLTPFGASLLNEINNDG